MEIVFFGNTSSFRCIMRGYLNQREICSGNDESISRLTCSSGILMKNCVHICKFCIHFGHHKSHLKCCILKESELLWLILIKFHLSEFLKFNDLKFIYLFLSLPCTGKTRTNKFFKDLQCSLFALFILINIFFLM